MKLLANHKGEPDGKHSAIYTGNKAGLNKFEVDDAEVVELGRHAILRG